MRARRTVSSGLENTVGKYEFVPYISPMKSARRTYQRRRVGALFIVAVVALALHTGGGAGADPEPLRYTVAPGDTLWDIALENTSPWEDPRPRVEEIREANDIPDATIYPGMRLELPRSG